VSVTNATTGTADVLNIVLTNATGGTVNAAKVETVNITSSATTGVLTLAATTATTVNVSGAKDLTLTNTGNVAVTLIDGSTMTGALTVTAAGTVAETIKGGSGADILTASTGTVADVLVGGAGNDTLNSNVGLTTLTGGAGNDIFTVSTVTANLNTYATITDAAAGDRIVLKNAGTETFTSAKVVLGTATPVFQDFANAVVAASVANNAANAAVGWFQFGGDTYIVESLHDNTASASPNFQNNIDLVVKLTGLVDLSTASLNVGTTPMLQLN
jgi:S-layer protein